jgi:predicted dehydrogenase
VRFESGAQGHWTAHFATTGESVGKRLIIGSDGTLTMPGDRSGKPVEVKRGGETLSGDALVSALPDYALNGIETLLFGERPASYSLQGFETDRKLIAAEMHDFVDAVRTRRPPEADGPTGLRSVALIYTVLESALAGRPLLVQDVLTGSVRTYQDKVETAPMG